MSTKKNLKYWEITTSVNGSFACFAGKTPDERKQMKYKTRAKPLDWDLFSEILGKIKQRIDEGNDKINYITVSVEPDGTDGTFIIIKDEPTSGSAPRALGMKKSSTKKNGRKKKPAGPKSHKSKDKK